MAQSLPLIWLAVLYTPLLVVRPSSYIVISRDELWYPKLVGRGRIVLSKVDSISTTGVGWATFLHSEGKRLRLTFLLTGYWDCLEVLVDRCKNANIDAVTMEVLKKDSPLSTTAMRQVKALHVGMKVVFVLLLVIASFLLLQEHLSGIVS
jgi:hypothetical protein